MLRREDGHILRKASEIEGEGQQNGGHKEDGSGRDGGIMH